MISFLDKVIATQSVDREVHIICDNLSAHETKAVNVRLDANPSVQIRYIRTWSSWLNQVEIWFGKSARDLMARAG